MANLIGDTPLHTAIRNFKEYLIPIKNLLEQDDSDINVPNLDGLTPLHLAVTLNKCCIGLMKLLLEHGADVTATTPDDLNTALHLVAMRAAEHSKWYPVASTLLENGSDANARNAQGCTPLHLVVERLKITGRSRIITELLDYGSDVNLINLNGDTPLHLYLENPWMASREVSLFHLREFLDRTRDVDLVNANGETALHVAVRRGCSFWKIRCLLQYGVDASIENARGQNAYQEYVEFWRALDELVEENDTLDPLMSHLLLVRRGGPLSLHVICLLHNSYTVRRLLRHGDDVNAIDTYGYSPLYYAIVVAVGDVDNDQDYSTLNLMLDYGADVNRQIIVPDPESDTGERSTNLFEAALDSAIYEADTSVSNDNFADVRHIFVHHGAKLLALQEKLIERGIDVELLSPHNCQRMRKELLEYADKGLLSRCTKMVKTMSETQVGESGMSFFDLLFASKEERTAIYARNKEVIKAFDAEMYQRMLNAKLGISGSETSSGASSTECLLVESIKDVSLYE